MKKEQQNLSKILWQDITDPYQTIAAFFDADNVANYRKYVRKMLIAACSNTMFKMDLPGELLHFYEKLCSLVEATHLINKEGKKSPLDIQDRDLFNPNLYCGWQNDCTEWDYFPRSLSKKEFIDPYAVLKRFFRRHKMTDWRQELHDLLKYALVKDSLYDVSIFIDPLSIYFDLTKLIEAAHLIDVREISHINGVIKPRIKNIR